MEGRKKDEWKGECECINGLMDGWRGRKIGVRHGTDGWLAGRINGWVN